MVLGCQPALFARYDRRDACRRASSHANQLVWIAGWRVRAKLSRRIKMNRDGHQVNPYASGLRNSQILTLPIAESVFVRYAVVTLCENGLAP